MGRSDLSASRWHWLAALFLAQLCLATVASADESLAARMQRGKDVYVRNCFICHQITGQGVPGAYPPLAKSDYLTNDVERSIRAVCEGLSGEIVVNGRKYAGAMPPSVTDDTEVADVFTFMLNSWGNPGGEVTACGRRPRFQRWRR
jgi:nitrite reductase (NO-forming)